ncbi:GNAT family N-acetyltransferase [Sandaracinus amylolyticus]|uniref:Putative acetyltransferase n=1 Tax=Sandaracinus amylolyticus TaxID=927083 RepID=A0A0F6SI73_9BACT|nr:GNAT family N-acetyltransferase [Sandaracinus amylolyticus]AKF11694.1 putative acetyltransferase [Sandaracinus amylolyticus]
MRTIETARLFLRDYTPDDAEAMLVIDGDPEVMHFLGGVQRRTVAEQRAFLEKVCAKFDGYRARGLPYCAMGAFERDTGALIGTALFKPLPFMTPGSEERVDTDDLEIGWHLARAAWGKGYATEFGAAMRERAFTTTAIDEVRAVVDPGNVRSERVASRLGLRQVGITERYYARTLTEFVLTRAEWEARSR